MSSSGGGRSVQVEVGEIKEVIDAGEVSIDKELNERIDEIDFSQVMDVISEVEGSKHLEVRDLERELVKRGYEGVDWLNEFSNEVFESSNGSSELDYIETEIEVKDEPGLEVPGKVSLDREAVGELDGYDDNFEFARKALELEWKRENVEDYLSLEEFSDGNLSSEAEILLKEKSSSERNEIIRSLVYESDHNLSSVYVHDDWGHLMGYDQDKGKWTTLVRNYDDIIDMDREDRVSDMLEDAKEVVDDYEKAAVKSVLQSDGSYVTEGEIGEEKLLGYLEEQTENI